MKGLVAAHSGLRYIVLALLVIAIFNAIANLKSNKYEKKDKMINLFAMIFLHIQLLLGLVLYFTNTFADFFKYEHAVLMLISVILITLGRRKAEKLAEPKHRHRMILRYYLLGLIIIFISIPWPFMYEHLSRPYF